MVAALRVEPVVVGGMLACEPRLLQLEPATFKARLEGMMYRLYLPRKQVINMIIRQPQLLLYLTTTLQVGGAVLTDWHTACSNVLT
jgi:hypothetical protein